MTSTASKRQQYEAVRGACECFANNCRLTIRIFYGGHFDVLLAEGDFITICDLYERLIAVSPKGDFKLRLPTGSVFPQDFGFESIPAKS